MEPVFRNLLAAQLRGKAKEGMSSLRQSVSPSSSTSPEKPPCASQYVSGQLLFYWRIVSLVPASSPPVIWHVVVLLQALRLHAAQVSYPSHRGGDDTLQCPFSKAARQKPVELGPWDHGGTPPLRASLWASSAWPPSTAASRNDISEVSGQKVPRTSTIGGRINRRQRRCHDVW